jgi:hypothetical protein
MRIGFMVAAIFSLGSGALAEDYGRPTAILVALALLSLAACPVFVARSSSIQQVQLDECYLGNQFVWVSCT